MIGLLKSPLTIGKGLAVTGSLGGLLIFFGFGKGLKGSEREFQITSTVSGNDWKSGFVTPEFDSSWLGGGGFESETKYSYGYVARVDGTDFFEEGNFTKRVRKDLGKSKQDSPEAKLTLIETVNGLSKVGKDGKEGLTPKKFLLVGSNRETGEVEVTGLVSLIQFGHNGISTKCSKTEDKGAILDGSCDKVFFKSYNNGETPPAFIKKELTKGEENSKSSVGIMQLTPKGKSLGVVWGQRKETGGSNGNKWSRTGYLYLSGKDTTSDSENVVRKVWTDIDKSKKVKGFFVVHDLIFSENGMSKEWVAKKAKYGTILIEGMKKKSEFKTDKKKDIRALQGQNGGENVIDIPLSSNRNYYIWDPSKTKIKNNEFWTDEGVRLPFKLNFNATWSSSLVK